MNIEPLIIGITGSIGSGKSTLSDVFRKQRYPVVSTDDIAKQIVSTDLNAQKKIINEFGNEAFINGIYNSQFVSSIVFSDPNKLNKLNQILHPAVIDAMISEIDNLQNNNDNVNLIFVESALIFELNLENGFDYVISVSASQQTRIDRIKLRSNLSIEQIMQRIESQMSQEEKNKMADFVVENNKTLAELYNAAIFLLPILFELPHKDNGTEK